MVLALLSLPASALQLAMDELSRERLATQCTETFLSTQSVLALNGLLFPVMLQHRSDPSLRALLSNLLVEAHWRRLFFIQTIRKGFATVTHFILWFPLLLHLFLINPLKATLTDSKILGHQEEWQRTTAQLAASALMKDADDRTLPPGKVPLSALTETFKTLLQASYADALDASEWNCPQQT